MHSVVTPASRFVPDDYQRQAIEHVHGPMLVVAGAGTGKTTVLIQRIARLIREGHARPEEIVALTYTDNAATEMKTRVRDVLGASAEGLLTQTFHAWCNELLQRHGLGFDVLDDKDLWVFLRRRIREFQLKHFIRAANVGQFLDDLLDFMRRCHDELVGPAEYADYVARLERGEIPLPRVARSKKQAELEDGEILERCREIARVFSTTENMLRVRNLGTFGHMITGAYHFLKERPDLLAAQRSRIRFLLVDEFQDVNFAQIEILALLAGGDPNPDLFVVGDPDQAIYMFRGASSEAFSLFAERFPSAKVVRLVKNRRSLAPILQCAFGIVNENPNPPVFGHRRARLDSWREEQAQERSQPLPLQPVEIVTWGDKDVEASDVAGRIQKLRRELHCDWREFTVLYRQHNHRDELVKELAERNIPFVIEGLDVLDTPEVRDVVACLSAAVNPNDGAALFRVAALPQFSIDAPALKSGMRSAPRGGLDLVAILGKISGGPEVLAAVENAQSAISADTVLAVPALNIVLRTFALPRTAALSSFFEFAERWQKSPATENRRAAEFLEYLGYFRQAKGSSVPLSPSKEDGVRLMTAHATKGLEFDHVVILRGASITFPCVYREPVVDFPRELRRSHPTLSDKELYEQEERRLYYVAMTRARDTLAIYAKQGTGTNKRPTKFLREFMSSPAYRSFWREREAGAVQDELFGAAEEERIAIQRSNVAAWLLTASPAGFTDHLSATAIETYEQCPLRFKLQTEWNLPRDAPAALQYGASMHRVLHTFYQARQMGREISDEHLLENFRADFASAGLPDRYQYELYLRQGREQLIQFLAWARSSPSPEVLHTEQPFELSIAGIQFTGRIDRIDRIEGADGKSVSIVDYKTGRPKSQDDADKSLQLSLYALAARRVWGLRADRLILHNLEDNTAAVTTRLDAELAQAEERVRAAAEGIAAGDFHAEPGRQCGLCPYRNLCPATEKVVHLPQKKTIRQAS